MTEEGSPWLSPEKLGFYIDDTGKLCLQSKGDPLGLPVTVEAIFPLSATESCLEIICSQSSASLGMLKNFAALDGASREAIISSTQSPLRILRVYKVRPFINIFQIAVATEEGALTIEIRRDETKIRSFPPARWILEDLHGTRYEIPDLRQLPRRDQGRMVQSLGDWTSVTAFQFVQSIPNER